MNEFSFKLFFNTALTATHLELPKLPTEHTQKIMENFDFLGLPELPSYLTLKRRKNYGDFRKKNSSQKYNKKTPSFS